jgi:hypothetical protein
MDATKKYPGIGLVLVCALGLVAGCATNPVHVTGKPSSADFDIAFLPAGSATPTDMDIQPDGGDAFLEAVSAPGAKDNKVVWKSSKHFQIRFVQVDDQDKPLKPGKELGNEGKDWNDAKQVGSDAWEYTLTLKEGSGRKQKETVAAKYLVKLVSPEVVFDPVIIVRR